LSWSVIVNRRRWWAHLLMLIPVTIFPVVCGFLALASAGILPQAGGWWKAPLLLAGAGVMGLAAVIALNALPSYRTELDTRGLRIVGNLTTHDLTWQEITLITKRRNHRIRGYHVGIKVDGSRRPRRPWCNLWFAGYFVHPGMEKGGSALSAYHKRKRRECLKRQ